MLSVLLASMLAFTSIIVFIVLCIRKKKTLHPETNFDGLRQENNTLNMSGGNLEVADIARRNVAKKEDTRPWTLF